MGLTYQDGSMTPEERRAARDALRRRQQAEREAMARKHRDEWDDLHRRYPL